MVLLGDHTLLETDLRNVARTRYVRRTVFNWFRIMSTNVTCLSLKQRAPSGGDESPLVMRMTDDRHAPDDVINNNDKGGIVNTVTEVEISEVDLESLEDEILRDYLSNNYESGQINVQSDPDQPNFENDTRESIGSASLDTFVQSSPLPPGGVNVNDIRYIECDVSDVRLDEDHNEASIDFFKTTSPTARTCDEPSDGVITSVPRPPTSSFATLRMNLSFAGCGFLGIYHLGVAHSLAHHGQKLMLNVQRFGGASAGSLVASALAIKGTDTEVIQECVDFCLDLAESVRRKKMGVLTPRVSLLEPLEAFLVKMFPEDAHLIARGRLFVSVTDARRRKNLLRSDFESKEHLIKYLLGSSYVPFITGSKSVKIDGKKYLDGGMTNNLPDLPDGRTILVTPFSGKQDICPHDKCKKERYVNLQGEDFQVNTQNLKRGLHAFFPPKRKHLDKYFQRGKDDAIRFLKREHFYTEGAS